MTAGPSLFVPTTAQGFEPVVLDVFVGQRYGQVFPAEVRVLA